MSEATDRDVAEPEVLETLLGNVRKLIDDVGSFDEIYGQYTVKSDARRTGASIYVKFTNKVDVMEAMRFVNFLSSSPSLTYSILRQLEAWLVAIAAERAQDQVALLDAALTAVTVAESLDQARGIAHAALNREEYHGHDL